MRITSPFQETLNSSRIFPDTPDNSDHELDHVPSQATELVTQVGKDDDVVEEVIHLMIVVRTMVKTTRLIMQKCPQKQVCCHRSREAHLWCLRPLNREPKLRCDPISLCALPLLCNHLQTPPINPLLLSRSRSLHVITFPPTVTNYGMHYSS